jgi:glycosyltransferase involved in cell wall biosynthesis
VDRSIEFGKLCVVRAAEEVHRALASRMRITATVITLDEGANIAAALDSVAWADEIVVLDSGSSDDTVELARRYTDRVFVEPWSGYARHKNRAAELASNDWIFSLDADERVTPELAESIARVRQSSSFSDGYRVARRAHYIDRWVYHSGWYPDWQVRLYDRRKARFEGEHVHESVRLNGVAGTLKGDLLHYTVDSLSDHHTRLDRYTTLAARHLYESGRRFSPIRALLQPPLTFLQTYLLRQGFRDGMAGLAIAGFAASYVFLREMKLWEQSRRED